MKSPISCLEATCKRGWNHSQSIPDVVLPCMSEGGGEEHPSQPVSGRSRHIRHHDFCLTFPTVLSPIRREGLHPLLQEVSKQLLGDYEQQVTAYREIRTKLYEIQIQILIEIANKIHHISMIFINEL